MARHTLLIDADDTLWENNIFFEKTIEHFVTQLEHLGYTREYIRHILNETEKRNIRQHGYGVRSFRRSLEETYMKLAGNAARADAGNRAAGRGAGSHAAAHPGWSAGDAGLSGEASPADIVDQGRAGRASREGGALWIAAVFRCD